MVTDWKRTKRHNYRAAQVEMSSKKSDNDSRNERANLEVLYGVNDRPPWYLCLLLGFQQVLTGFGGTFVYALLIKDALCITGDNVGLGELISTVTFVGGVSTLLQTTFGIRLPIIQSVSFAFVSPIFAILSNKVDSCPYSGTSENTTTLPFRGSDEHREIWQGNLRQLQGCVMVASLLSVVIGFSGLIGLLMKFIGPLTVAPTITLIALSLFESAASQGSGHWYICLMTVSLVALFSQYLRDVAISCPSYKEGIKIFALFPVLLATALAWITCIILTETNVLTDDRYKWGYAARTDIQLDVLHQSKWFRFPYPGQWGPPSVSLAGVVGMMAGILASTIESVGDYYACARLAGAPAPPASAINRGIGVEGLTCILAGVWGTGGGSTSYSENVGTIGITKVGSRVVIQTAGVIMIVLGCLGKVGALFVTIPSPVVGGLFFVMFGMVGAVGISNLQFVDMNSPRNLFVFGVPLFCGLSASGWINKNPEAIDTGNTSVDQTLRVLLGTNMLVGGVLACLLDNTIPGTREERGLVAWSQMGGQVRPGGSDQSVYDMPWFIQSWLHKLSFSRFCPACPGFVLNKNHAQNTEEQVSEVDQDTNGDTRNCSIEVKVIDSRL